MNADCDAVMITLLLTKCNNRQTLKLNFNTVNEFHFLEFMGRYVEFVSGDCKGLMQKGKTATMSGNHMVKKQHNHSHSQKTQMLGGEILERSQWALS